MALLVFLAFYLAAKVLRGAARRIFEKRIRHRNVGFVVGRLAQGTLVILGLLVVPRPRGIGAALRELPRALGKEGATKRSDGP